MKLHRETGGDDRGGNHTMTPDAPIVLMTGTSYPAALRSDAGDNAGYPIAPLGLDRVAVGNSGLKTEESGAAYLNMNMWESHGSHFEKTFTLHRLNINFYARFNS